VQGLDVGDQVQGGVDRQVRGRVKLPRPHPRWSKSATRQMFESNSWRIPDEHLEPGRAMLETCG